MEISYTLELEDFLVNQLYIASNSKIIRKKRLINWLLIPVLYLVISFINYIDQDVVLAGIFLLFSILWVIFYPKYSKKRYVKHFTKHIKEHFKQRLGKPITMSFLDEHIFHKADLNESKVVYSDVIKIIKLSTNYLISLESGGNIILPLRNNDLGIDNFINELKNKVSIEVSDETNWKWK